MEQDGMYRDIRFAEYTEEEAIRALSTNLDEVLERDTVDGEGDAIYETLQILVNGKLFAFPLTGTMAAGLITFIKEVCKLDGHAYPWPDR